MVDDWPESLSRVNLRHVAEQASDYLITPKFNGMKVKVIIHQGRMYIGSTNQLQVSFRLPATNHPTSIWHAEAMWCQSEVEIHLFDVRVHEGKLCDAMTKSERLVLLPDLTQVDWLHILPISWYLKRYLPLDSSWSSQVTTANQPVAAGKWLTPTEWSSLTSKNIDTDGPSQPMTPNSFRSALKVACQLARSSSKRTPSGPSGAIIDHQQREVGQVEVDAIAPPAADPSHDSKNQCHDDHPSWFWSQDGRQYNIDGFIIISRNHHHGEAILKWKPAACVTLDFQVDGKLYSAAQLTGSRSGGIRQIAYELAPPSWGRVVHFFGHTSKHEYVKVPKEWRFPFQGKPLVVECWYNRKLGYYQVQRLRPDKDRGNSSLTHIQTLYDQLDQITFSEIKQ
jgi:hypothetical protein